MLGVKHQLRLSNPPSSKKFSIWKNATKLGSARIAAKLLGFAWTVFLARSLGLTGFGEFAYLTALTILFSIFSEAGLSTIITRDLVARTGVAEALVPTAIVLTTILNCIASLALLLTASINDHTHTSLLVVAVAALYLPANGVNNMLAAVLRGNDRFGMDSTVNLVDAVLFISLSAAAVLAKLGLLGIVCAYSGRQFIVLFCYWALTRQELKRLQTSASGTTGRTIRYLLREGIPLTLSGAAAQSYVRIDIVMLSFIAGAPAAAIYSVASRFIDGLMVGVASVGWAALPKLASLDRIALKRFTLRVAAISAIASTVVVIPLMVAGPRLVQGIFGRSFGNSGTVLQVLLLVVPLYAASQVFRGSLVVVGKQLTLTVIYLGAVFISIVLNELLIPRFSYFGSALAALAVAASLVAALYVVILAERDGVRLAK